MESSKIKTTSAPADSEIIRRHLIVYRNECNEADMRIHSLLVLEMNAQHEDLIDFFARKTFMDRMLALKNRPVK